MTKLKLSVTPFESIHYSSSLSQCAHGDSVHHRISVWNAIVINGEEFKAIYQTGVSFCCNSYSAPSNRLEFSENASGEGLCSVLNGLYESDFDDEELIAEKLEKAKEYCADIDTKEQLFEVYQFFNDNEPCNIWSFINEEHTDNLKDYEFDENQEYLILKRGVAG